MTPETMDDAIRALVKNVARVTIEEIAEVASPDAKARLLRMREQIADDIAEITMSCADESPDSEVHAVRAFGGGR